MFDIAYFRRGALTASFLASALIAGCPDDPVSSLTITAPRDGAVLTLADDVDPATAGIQFNVTVDTQAVAEGAPVTLFLDGNVRRAPDATVAVNAEGEAVFRVDASARSTFDIIACINDCAAQARIQVSLDTACAAIEFVSPVASEGSVTLAARDDTTGAMCEGDFTVNVDISTDAPTGSMAQLFVNGMPVANANVTGPLLRFADVVLSRRGDQANTLMVSLTRSSGQSCDASSGQIFVQCAGPEICEITQPGQGSGFLNAADDSSEEVGFQGDFTVSTDLALSGRTVRLLVDSAPRTAVARTVDTSAAADFARVPLDEGLHSFRAECTDAAGNTTSSGVVQWTVDTVPCGVTIASPGEDQLFIDSDDVNSTADGIQTEVSGSISGDDCESIVVGLCDASGVEASVNGEDFLAETTLGTTPMQTLCATVVDMAGNEAVSEVAVRVRSAAPTLVMETASQSYNRLGAEGFTADLNPATVACDAAFSALCSDVGAMVELVRGDTTSVLATAPCESAEGLPAPYMGRATFDSVALPSLNSGASYDLSARSTVDRLTGSSAAIAVFPDCEAPILSVSRPTCGSALRPAQDENPMMDGLQYRVNIVNGNTPAAPVTLTLMSGAAEVYRETSAAMTGAVNNFPAATFTAGGSITIRGCTLDASGNEGCTDACAVNVENVPQVTLVAPVMDAVLAASADCNSGNATPDVLVRATSADAAADATASVTVGALAAFVTTPAALAAGVCVPAEEGTLSITAAVTDARGTGRASATVTVDMTPPTTPVSNLALAVNDRRGGVATATWTAVGDGVNSLSALHLRCAAAAISSEAAWTAATVMTVEPGAPRAAGASESRTVSGFRVGSTYHCVVRGADASGALSPLGNDASVEFAWLRNGITAAGDAAFGGTSAYVGDVNGDDVGDFVVQGNNAVHLVLGVDGGFPTTATTRIAGPAQIGNKAIAGIGDFNGDGLGDFAVGAAQASGFAGAVYVFYGRASWPALIDVSSSCGANLCVRGATQSFLGAAVAGAGDHDGDGTPDLIVGASAENTLVGAAYVLLGGSSLPSGDQPIASMNGFRYTAMAGTGQFGQAVLGLGDTTSDGRADIIVTAPGRTSPVTPGHGYFIQGRAHAPSAVGTMENLPGVAMNIQMSGTAGRFGTGGACIGDMNGDGLVDAALFDALSSGAGEVQVHPGSMFALAPRFTNDSASANNDFFGQSTAIGYHPIYGRLGDLDGDNRTELLVGSTQNGADAGTAHLFWGQAPFAATTLRSAGTTIPAMTGGSTVSYVGDVDSDGAMDFLVGFAANGTAIVFH